MAERGLTKDVVKETVRNPLVKLSQDDGKKFLYISEKAAVVVNDAGKVVTTYGKNNFYQPIKDIIIQIKNIK